jgi:hypothetical protein
VIAAAVAVGAPRAAAADIGAFGVNDIRSDGLLMRHAEYDGVGDMELMRQGGIRLYRARVRMDCVDPDGDGAFDFTGPGRGCPDYDELVGELARRGITLLPVLMNFGTNAEGREHPLAPTGRDGAPSVERFAAFARAVAERYGPTGSFWGVCGCDPRPIRAWQIWNEQNNGWWWNGRASADEYARLFAATRAALRAVDPEARAIVGGLTYDRNGEASFVSPEKVIARLAATNPNAFDAVAVHPYTDARVGDGQRIGAAALRLVERTAQAVARATGPARDGGPAPAGVGDRDRLVAPRCRPADDRRRHACVPRRAGRRRAQAREGRAGALVHAARHGDAGLPRRRARPALHGRDRPRRGPEAGVGGVRRGGAAGRLVAAAARAPGHAAAGGARARPRQGRQGAGAGHLRPGASGVLG